MNNKINSIKDLVTANLEDEKQVDTLLQASLAHIKAEQELLNNYISIIDEPALEDAKKGAKNSVSKELYGMPISIKDNIVVREFPLTCASRMLENFKQPIYNATVTKRLRAAGAVIMGKANMDEFAMGSNGETSYFGPTKNPFDTAYVPGGSSSGSAVSVAAGGVIGSLGTDTGGSVRQPASFNNLVGMKPSYGRIPRFGVAAFSSSLDQVGVLAHTVENNAKILEIVAGHDAFDTTSSTKEVPAYSENLESSLVGKKIAYFKEFFTEEVHEDIRKAMHKALDTYRKLGAEVTEVSVPELAYVVPTYYIIACSEASSNLARYDGLHYGHRAEGYQDTDDIMRFSRAEGFGEEVKKRLLLGTYYLSSASYEENYLKAAKMRQVILNAFTEILTEHDVIVGPTTPVLPKKIGVDRASKNEDYLNDLCTIPANLTGLPALTLPAGFTSNNLPIGMQIMGRPFSEQEIYQFAYAFEKETKYYEHLAPCVAEIQEKVGV